MDAQSQPLSDRSTNTIISSPSKTAQDSVEKNNMSMEYHRQMLQEKMNGDDEDQKQYVSPSDGIMSPCTKKLSNLKGKRFSKAGKPQSLFAKTVGKSFDNKA